MDSERLFTYNVLVVKLITNSEKEEKVIFHMDGDAFFVGVEMAKNPALRGKPVVTGGERGIVSALSYEAKAIGIVRGMPIYRVKKFFPTVIILPGDYKSYAQYSNKMFNIVRRYADNIEEYSIDECFADLTGLEPSLKMSYLEIAQKIKKEINEELKLSISIGIAPTKVLAKVASKWTKPNGLTVINLETIPNFLAKTPIEKIWGIGPKTAELLKKKGIITALNFINKDLNWIKTVLSKPYEVLWQELQGKYLMTIDSKPKTIYSSIQKTYTFYPPTNDKDYLISEFSKNIEEGCRKARYYKLTPKKISFFLKDKNFKYYIFSIKLTLPTNAPETIISLIQNNLDQIYKFNTLYRTTGVTLEELISDSNYQKDLFSNNEQTHKFELIHRQIDSLETKFGKTVLYLVSTHKANKKRNTTDRNNDLDRDLIFL